MFDELQSRVRKAGQPPGSALYTGKAHKEPPTITVITYDSQNFSEITGSTLEECLTERATPHTTWIQVEGLTNTGLIEQIATRYQLHPLTLEDILNVGQRPKVEEFEHYIFIALRELTWDKKTRLFTTEQISLVMGKDFLLSFQERKSPLLDNIHKRFQKGPNERLRQHDSDYLAYRIIDTVIDKYFVVLEGLGEDIQKLEELIITKPTRSNAHKLYMLKRQLLMIRRAIWPIREAISHLLQTNGQFITQFTRIYLRDVYDHAVQALDTLETFRDMLSGILDIYLSSLTIRMNEIMKVLTIIATIFIPLTFITSLYGMNFHYMPELSWRWGYPMVLILMLVIALGMLRFFRRKKWI